MSYPTLNFALGETIDMLRDQVQAFVAAELTPRAAQIDKDNLFPDMFPLVRQVQIAVDFAKGVSARLAEIEVPKYEDTEVTFADLQALIAKVLAFIDTITPAQIDGKEGIEIVTRPGTPKEKRFSGQSYLLTYGLPQFFFHVTTAYALLRHNGVEVGKRDYMGAF